MAANTEAADGNSTEVNYIAVVTLADGETERTGFEHIGDAISHSNDRLNEGADKARVERSFGVLYVVTLGGNPADYIEPFGDDKQAAERHASKMGINYIVEKDDGTGVAWES